MSTKAKKKRPPEFDMDLYQALEWIAEKHLPCRACGERHHFRLVNPRRPRQGGTFAGADGHIYSQMTPREFALAVLRAQSGVEA